MKRKLVKESLNDDYFEIKQELHDNFNMNVFAVLSHNEGIMIDINGMYKYNIPDVQIIVEQIKEFLKSRGLKFKRGTPSPYDATSYSQVVYEFE